MPEFASVTHIPDVLLGAAPLDGNLRGDENVRPHAATSGRPTPARKSAGLKSPVEPGSLA